MLLGISDTWVDGLESYVLVAADAATPVLARFGQVVRSRGDSPSPKKRRRCSRD